MPGESHEWWRLVGYSLRGLRVGQDWSGSTWLQKARSSPWRPYVIREPDDFSLEPCSQLPGWQPSMNVLLTPTDLYVQNWTYLPSKPAPLLEFSMPWLTRSFTYLLEPECHLSSNAFHPSYHQVPSIQNNCPLSPIPTIIHYPSKEAMIDYHPPGFGNGLIAIILLCTLVTLKSKRSLENAKLPLPCFKSCSGSSTPWE